MKHIFIRLSLFIIFFGGCLTFSSCTKAGESLELQSENGLNTISLWLNETGELFYKINRKNQPIIEESALGLKCNDQDFTTGLSLENVSQIETTREDYQLMVGNNKSVDHILQHKSITFKNTQGHLIVIDLVAGNEGVAFRYRFPESGNQRTIEKEVTTIHIENNAKGWLQPYNKAGDYTPGYEDFYLDVKAGDSIANERNASIGWCMPALFQVNKAKNWVLVAESGTEGSYPGCHLDANSEGGIYKVAFAAEDEKYTLPLEEKENAYPISTLPWTMPWRVFIIGDDAGEILLSTMITDLAPASKIEDTSWIETGKASWSWWSHPDDHSAQIYNEFTDLADSFNWEYTLFDAGWEKANEEGGIIDTAIQKGIKPLVWGFSGSYYKPDERKRRFKELADMGIRGVKIDFWCSDRQEVMGVIQSLFEDAAKEHLMINLHGTTVPRGWHRTWPNYMTAEAILGTESYFYEPRFPDKAAEQNTVLPFTRNVAGPADYTPFALTIRSFPRLNTAAHELATSMIYTSGIIHFADSKEVFDSLPEEVKTLFKEMPSTWDKTESIKAEPGKLIILSRQKGDLSYIIGINGTNEKLPVNIDLSKYGKGFSDIRLIKEGNDPLMDFETQTLPKPSNWSYTLAPKGGFVLQFVNKK